MNYFSNDWLRNRETGLATSYNHFKQKCRVSFEKTKFSLNFPITPKVIFAYIADEFLKKLKKNEKNLFFF